MQDRSDLIKSELAGLAFDSLQQVFCKADIKIAINAMSLTPCPLQQNAFVFVVIDPINHLYVCKCVYAFFGWPSQLAYHSQVLGRREIQSLICRRVQLASRKRVL